VAGDPELTTRQVIERLGTPFATFDARTQDSGHVSYGVQGADGRRWFVKTAGEDTVRPGGLSFSDRVTAVRRAAEIQVEVSHPAFVALETVVEAADGVVVVYDWFDGQLLRIPPAVPGGRAGVSPRFRALSLEQRAEAVDAVIDLHVALEDVGWIAGDFYDGSLMYDFATEQIKVIDLESYRHGSYVNTVGRLPGSSRYMAPEEHVVGATVDARTTVFNLGRMIETLVQDGHRVPQLDLVTTTATSREREARPASVRALQAAWRTAVEGSVEPSTY
jgi:serine/threonine protein kinase